MASRDFAHDGSLEKGTITPPEHLEAARTNTSSPEESRSIAPIRTISRVPGNSNYYEKNGLRTEGDGVDHTHYNPRSLGFIMTVLGCSFALAGSQIIPLLYLTLGTTIARALNASNLLIWLLTAGIVAQGALAPFVGPLADLFGRKPIFLIGLACSMLGGILCASTPNAAGFMAGQVFFGFGGVIQELLAISVVAEIVPTAKRSMYAALILTSIIPWSPGTAYANFIAEASWRWIGCTLSIWHAITFAILAWFYRPPPRVNSLGLSRREMIGRIDFVGGFLITMGMLLFLIGLNWGGQQYSWDSAHVTAFLVVGGVLIIAFGFWEWLAAPYPLFPRRMIHAPRPFFCLMFVIFAAGINYVGIVVFWPIESISVYGSNRYETGINTLPIGLGILGGAILSAVLIGIFQKRVTFIMTFFCVMQTVSAACLVVVNPHDVRSAITPIVLSLIGTGGVLIPNQVIITVITPDDLIASVTALTVGLRAQAQVLGLAIFYNRLVYQVTRHAYKTIVPALIISGVYDIDTITNFITGLTAVPYKDLASTIPGLVGTANAANYELTAKAVLECFSEAIKWVWYITIPFGVCACVVAAFMGDVSQYMDEHVAVVL
ncbi:related to trichothecene efflux pump [Phialocephala subalpina]|uniref:Related to trichothecene efflux pump n=1 Tax=Phialocephala subalpina TaxID=576137 RepID=A0A1L7XJG8_9HELO|nr:related to trichothecene efflux pump [Phialocephala subalpina]